METQEFRFAHDHGPVTIEAGCVDGLEAELERLDWERALVVSLETVGTTESVIGPVRRGLGDRLVDVYAGTTPARRLDTAIYVADEILARDVDIVTGLGGGSSLDVATVTSVLGAADRARAAVIEIVPGDRDGAAP